MNCGKKPFVNMEEALSAIALIRKRSSRDKIPVRAYPCPDCGKFHITSFKKPKKKKGIGPGIRVKKFKYKYNDR